VLLFAGVGVGLVVVQQWPLPRCFACWQARLLVPDGAGSTPQGQADRRMWEEISDAGAPDTFGWPCSSAAVDLVERARIIRRTAAKKKEILPRRRRSCRQFESVAAAEVRFLVRAGEYQALFARPGSVRAGQHPRPLWAGALVAGLLVGPAGVGQAVPVGQFGGGFGQVLGSVGLAGFPGEEHFFGDCFETCRL
jgi:hypothetical protein